MHDFLVSKIADIMHDTSQTCVSISAKNTCSNSTAKTLVEGVTYVKSYQKNTRTMSMTSFWCPYCLLLTWVEMTHLKYYIEILSKVSIVKLYHVFAYWDTLTISL